LIDGREAGMNDDVLEVLAQMYVTESREARRVMDVIGSDTEEYHLTVGRRSALMMVADKFGRVPDLLGRATQIERGL
jgi:hypothetical protein